MGKIIPETRICIRKEQNNLKLTLLYITNFPGFFPTPIYFGAIINSACSLWGYSCGSRGACWLYDIVKLRYSFFGVNLGLRALQIPVCIAILITVKETLTKVSKVNQEK